MRVKNQDFYIRNEKYTKFLASQDIGSFNKLVDMILNLTSEKSKILDVGCGVGQALDLLQGRKNKEGVDISKTSIEICLSKGLNCKLYNGYKLPYRSNYFDLVYSYNVLEHVDDVEEFLNESTRVLKARGILIIVCPNFLSVTNSYHPHTQGIYRKILNLVTLVFKYVYRKPVFSKMPTTSRDLFQPDDDACNVTNPIDIVNWASSSGYSRLYWSGQILDRRSLLFRLVDKTPLKVLFGACFIVFQRT